MSDQTRDPIIWGQYLAWYIQNRMSCIGWWEPIWLARRRMKRGDLSGRRRMMWLYRPWSKVRTWFRRRTGGRSHRCEFTDPGRGALYGGKEGGYMERYFEEFLRRIDASPPA